MKQKLLLFLYFISASLLGQQAYYNGVDFSLSGVDLKQALADKITSTHVKELIYTPEVWEASKITDVNPENANEVLLIYGYTASGVTARTRGLNNNGGSAGEWNREHVYPRSLGSPNLGTEDAGADVYNLRPADVTYNSDRSNKAFANGSGNSGDVSGGWYPGDEWKGDVARMMMYMYLRYGDRCLPSRVGLGNNSATPDDMIDLFLIWNVEDPVSDFERQRNTYHGESSNTYAQGNRNPFVDNAYLATRIWGGDAAEDTWGIFTTQDTEAPSIPTNVIVSNETTTTLEINWTASTDNEAINGYDIYLDGDLNGFTATTTYTAIDLMPNSTYSITVIANDVAGNESDSSIAINGSTLEDLSAPTVPSDVSISNQTGSSFQVSWSASTDDSGILEYEIYVDDALVGNTAELFYNITDLNPSTSYNVKILAEDIANNKSDLSSPVVATTTDGSSDVAELFFSEYVEGTGFNKAVEIVNLTSNNVDLSPYTIRRQSLGEWEAPLQLTGTITVNDVFVIANSQADLPKLLEESDMTTDETPITFNGDDRVGLFKNGVLIDIIGDLNGTSVFAQNVTLRRNSDVSEPSTDYNEQREWSFYDVNTVDNIGVFNSTLSSVDIEIVDFQIYPNPAAGKQITFRSEKNIEIEIFSILGKKVKSFQVKNHKKVIDISNLASGIYLIKGQIQQQTVTKKLVIE